MTPNTVNYLENADLLGELLSNWKQQYPDAGVLCLLPEHEKARVPDIQAVCRALGIPVVGAIFPALVVDANFVQQGMLLMRFDRCPSWFVLDHLDGSPEASARRIAEACQQSEETLDSSAQPTLFLIFDGLIGTIGSVLMKLYDELRDSVRYAGVNAGSETFTPMPCLFDHLRLLGNGVLGVLMQTPQQPVVRHAYPVSKTLLRATSMSGNRIKSIDNRPPLEVYQEVMQKEFSITLTRENFYDHAVHYPFGEIGPLNVLVRIPVGFDDDGALYCIGEIPNNSILRLIQAPKLEDSDCVQQIADQLASTSLAPRPFLVTFYCAGRRLHLGEAAQEELKHLMAATRTSHLVGALSLGEIDTDETLGLPQFHNAALVCCG